MEAFAPIFHLVPTNGASKRAILRPDNRCFVSRSRTGSEGLRVGIRGPNWPIGGVVACLAAYGELQLRRDAPTVGDRDDDGPVVGFRMLTDTSSSVQLIVCLEGAGDTESGVFLERLVDHDMDSSDAVYDSRVLSCSCDYLLTVGVYCYRLAWPRLQIRSGGNHHHDDGDIQTSTKGSLEDDEDFGLQDTVDANPATGLLDVPQKRWLVGHGGFGIVYGSETWNTREAVAVKVLRTSEQRHNRYARSSFLREARIMQTLNHTNILRLLGRQRMTSPTPELVLPLCVGSLHNLGVQTPAVASRTVLADRMLRQMLSALNYLTLEGIVHRDIKPQNILYRYEDGFLQFQLADFGLAAPVACAKTVCGTPQYRAPELGLVHPFAQSGRQEMESEAIAGPGQVAQMHKMDIWSLFATTAMMLFFSTFPPSDMALFRLSSSCSLQHGLRERCLKQGWNVLEPMARLNPSHRASAIQMLTALCGGRGLEQPDTSNLEGRLGW